MARIRALKICSLRCRVKREVIRIVNLVRTVAETSRVAEVRRHDCRERFTALRRRDAADLPSAQHGIRPTLHRIEVWTAVPHRKFIEVAKREAMPQVGCHRTMLQVGPERVLDEASGIAI